jgi:hypothetical protein
VGFEPTIAVLEREKTVRALGRPATAIGTMLYDVEYIDRQNTSSSCLIQFYSDTPYYMKHIFAAGASIRKSLQQ